MKKLICKQIAYKEVEKVQETPPHPSAIKIIVKKYLDRPIKDSENGLLIQELFMKAGDRIQVLPRGNDSLLNMPLLAEGTKKLAAKPKEAVRSLFDMFAIADKETPDLLYLNQE